MRGALWLVDQVCSWGVQPITAQRSAVFARVAARLRRQKSENLIERVFLFLTHRQTKDFLCKEGCRVDLRSMFDNVPDILMSMVVAVFFRKWKIHVWWACSWCEVILVQRICAISNPSWFPEPIQKPIWRFRRAIWTSKRLLQWSTKGQRCHEPPGTP